MAAEVCGLHWEQHAETDASARKREGQGSCLHLLLLSMSLLYGGDTQYLFMGMAFESVK